MSSPTPIHPPQPAELLSRNPPTLTRPLALLDGRAYAAVWLPARDRPVPPDPAAGPSAEPNRSSPASRLTLHIVSQDGQLYGPGGLPFSLLPLAPRFPAVPPVARLWSPTAVQAFCGGRRPDPLSVHHRLCAAFDTFVDFDRSLAPQPVMCELMSLFVLSTWLSDAFGNLGHLWLTGDGGDNQARLFLTLLQLGHLGTLAGPADAPVLRGLAEYGALLAHDLTVAPSRPQRLASQLRESALAGARRGLALPLREFDARGQSWNLRLASAYCPRIFTALGPPDPRLAPFCLVVPLVRSADHVRAGLDPLHPASWPLDPTRLQDDLWALALTHLTSLPAHDLPGCLSSSVPAPLQRPWSAIARVAAWLQSLGADHLLDRLCAVALAYQAEAWHIDPQDLTPLIVRALTTRCAGLLLENRESVPDTMDITTRDVISSAGFLIEPDSPIRHADLTPQRVGRLLSQLRIPRSGRDRFSNSRFWRITPHDLRRLAAAYGLPLPSQQ